MPGPKIVIVGAGPAGLTFARLLQKNGIACTIYEAEKDRGARNQGGSLDLHPQSGQLAVKEAGLFEEFKRLSRPEGQALKLVKYDGRVVADENVSGNMRPPEIDDRPEIDRTVLRGMLLDSVQPESIKWGHKISSVKAQPGKEGRHTITFADGSEETDIDLIVGADGAWSKIRPLVTDMKPFYSGITSAELWALNVTKNHPWLSDYIGAGSLFMFDEGRALLCQRSGDDSIRVYAGVRKPETWKDDSGLDWSDHQSIREALVSQYYGDCGDDLKRVIQECNDECVPRQLWMMPVGHRWNSQPGVTLLGDAAHVMTPFAGVGVNLAMTDSLVLARTLIQRKDQLNVETFNDTDQISRAIKEYEAEMFERVTFFAKKTERGLIGHFDKDGIEEMMSRIEKPA